MARGSEGRSVLHRVVSVLEAFPRDRPTLTVGQLARRAGLPSATAYRIVAELVDLGLLERVEGEVCVGVRLWEIASRAPRALGLREAAMPFLEDLQAVTRQHVQIGVLEGMEVLFIERLSARQSVVNFTVIGGRLPLYASSSGLVLLAHAGTELLEQVLARPRTPFTDATPVEERRLRQVLAGVRKREYAACPGFLHPDAMGIAVPVRDSAGAVVAAMGVVVPVHGASVSAHVMGLRTASAGITRALGGGAGPLPAQAASVDKD